jgi:hypothetical protein
MLASAADAPADARAGAAGRKAARVAAVAVAALHHAAYEPPTPIDQKCGGLTFACLDLTLLLLCICWGALFVFMGTYCTVSQGVLASPAWQRHTLLHNYA